MSIFETILRPILKFILKLKVKSQLSEKKWKNIYYGHKNLIQYFFVKSYFFNPIDFNKSKGEKSDLKLD